MIDDIMYLMKAKIIIVFFISILAYSCKNESKTEVKIDQEVTSKSKTIKSSGHIDDSVAKQMSEMFGGDASTFQDLMKTDSLEMQFNKAFSSEGLQEMLATSNLSEEEKKLVMSEMQKMTTNGNGKVNGDTKATVDAYFKELETALTNPESKQQLRELQAMMNKQNISHQLDGLSTPKLNPKIENLRKVLGTDEKSFIENELTSYNLYGGNKEKQETLMKVATASKAEGETILMEHFQVSKKELELLKTIPDRQHVSTESFAKQILKEPVPKRIADQNASSEVSPKFKHMTEYHYQEQKSRAEAFIKDSKLARAKFYEENPGWYGEKSELGNTYIDSRHKFIYLPLGSLSFADKVISHQLGNPPGSNTQGSINEPDFALERFYKADPRICNLGIRGVLTLEFTDNAIADVNGADLYIFEMGAIEPTILEISKDGKTWVNVGKIDGGTAKVDIAPFIPKGETYNYIRLTDLATDSELPGADVDAVAAIGGALRLNLDSAVLFDTGKFQLKASASGELKKLVDAIKAIPKAKIVVEGHTDNVGNPASNKTLSENRAKEVSNYLKTKLSSSYQFEIKGYGDSQPVAPNDSDENKQKNRRVEILVIPN
ncbi:MAG: OmpA family protein [Aquaticitalea sp.]